MSWSLDGRGYTWGSWDDDFRTHWRKLVAHSGEKPFPVFGAHSAVASTVEKNQTNLLLGKQFKETFKDPQWRKVKQMQPMRLCLLSGKWFEETFKDAQWWKVKQMQPLRLCLLRASDLKKHLKMHSGEKSNKCNQCDYVYFRASDLKKHLKMHSGEKSNKCNQCKYTSSQVSGKQFDKTFKYTQWRKVKQM